MIIEIFLISFPIQGLPFRTYHDKYLIIFWVMVTFLIRNFYVSDIQAMFVSRKEMRIETFDQLIEKEDIKILIDFGSYAYRILEKV
jgi:hypothetical protein